MRRPGKVEVTPVLSVVVTITGGSAHLGRCLQALESQKGAPPLEILVPFDPALDDIQHLRASHPSVKFLEMTGPPCGAGPHPGLVHLMYDRRSAMGLRAASGDIVAMTEDHAIPGECWCANIVAAHRLIPFGAIGGTIEFAGDSALNRAVFLCDFGRFENPVPEGPAEYLTDVNVSYKRAALERVREVWRELFHETAAHGALRALGETLWLTPRLVVRHDRGRLHLWPLLRERIAWARVFAGRRVARVPLRTRLLLAAGSPALPFLLLARSVRTVLARTGDAWAVLRTLPAMWLLVWALAYGEFLGYLTARPNTCPAYQKPARRSVVPVSCQNCVIFQALSNSPASSHV